MRIINRAFRFVLISEDTGSNQPLACLYRLKVTFRGEKILDNIMANDKIELARDFITFPEELNKECTKEDFHKIMSSHNSDIPIERVNFKGYPENKMDQ